MRLFMTILCGLTLSLAPASAWAQNDDYGVSTTSTGPRKQLVTIIFSGLAGAVLGLSTLSFYGRPQDHLTNIATGFAVGVIGGTIYTTYLAATRPYGGGSDALYNIDRPEYVAQDNVPVFKFQFEY